jgi:hypothetical protein
MWQHVFIDCVSPPIFSVNKNNLLRRFYKFSGTNAGNFIENKNKIDVELLSCQ